MTRFSRLFILCSAIQGSVWAASYYVDPVNGDMDNPGTAESPWRTLAEVFSRNIPFKGGDTIYLRSGYHGDVTVKGQNDSYVTIKALPGQIPAASRIRIKNARFWRIEGLEISPQFAKEFTRQTMVDIADSTADISIENCKLYSVKDISKWSADDWVAKSCFGFLARGTRIRLTHNHLLNVDHGITILGKHNVVEGNMIENFSGDGIRALGDDCVYRGNMIRNCYDVDDNHDDGIQSWSTGERGVGTGVVKNVVIDGNFIISCTDGNRKYKGTLQGIGCFDGIYENWLVANNVIIVDHWHGISLYGAKNCRIVNNTVVDINEQRPGPPWIVINNHKKGFASTGNLIRNNLAKKFTSKPDVGLMDHNMIITRYEDFFVDYGKFDLHLKPDCPAIDAGSNDQRPANDFFGNPRVHGDRADIGAIEYKP